MSDEELIAEAREFLRSENAQYYDSSLIGALADALEAATDGDYHEGLEEGIKIGRAERDATDTAQGAVMARPSEKDIRRAAGLLHTIRAGRLSTIAAPRWPRTRPGMSMNEGEAQARLTPTREQIEKVLTDHELGDGGDPHSWRCEYPEIYPGHCTCVRDIATDLLALIDKLAAGE